MMYKLQRINKTYLALILFAVLIAAFYGNTLQNGFVSDDRDTIQTNPYVQSLTQIPRSFIDCPTAFACSGVNLYYRPLHYVAIILTSQISSEAWFFHLVNLLYFFAEAALVFFLAKLLTKHYWSSVAAAVLFIVHPIHSGAVNYISAIPEHLMTIFVLLATIFYLFYRQQPKKYHLAFVYLFYTLALFSKEPAVVFPLAVVALDLFYFQYKLRDIFRWPQLRTYLLFAIPAFVYIFLRESLLGTAGNAIGEFGLAERIYALFTLFAQYIWKLFYPYPLSISYTFERGAGLLNLPFLASLVLTAGFAVGVFLLLKKKQFVFVFSAIWFVVFLSIVLLFLGGRGDNLFAELYLFLPSVGFSLAVGSLFGSVISLSARWKQIAFGALAVVIAVSWLVVFPRNTVWKDNLTLYNATLKVNPHAHNLRRDVAYIYLERGEYEEAKRELEELIARAPDWKDITMAYKGLGDYYRAQGDSETALEYYETAGKTSSQAPRDYVVYNDIGALRMNKGEYLKGFAAFCRSLGLYSESAAVRDNFNDALAIIDTEYIQKGVLYEKILEEFTKAAEENIVFQDKRCDEKSCEYAFSFQAQQFEVLPPFLITAATASAKELEITNKGFNPETSIIILELDSKHKDQTLTFLFPTCQGIYYEARTVSSK